MRGRGSRLFEGRECNGCWRWGRTVIENFRREQCRRTQTTLSIYYDQPGLLLTFHRSQGLLLRGALSRAKRENLSLLVGCCSPSFIFSPIAPHGEARLYYVSIRMKFANLTHPNAGSQQITSSAPTYVINCAVKTARRYYQQQLQNELRDIAILGEGVMLLSHVLWPTGRFSHGTIAAL